MSCSPLGPAQPPRPSPPRRMLPGHRTGAGRRSRSGRCAEEGGHQELVGARLRVHREREIVAVEGDGRLPRARDGRSEIKLTLLQCLYRPWPLSPLASIALPPLDPEEAQSPPPLPLPPPVCAYHPPLPVNINPVAPPPLTCAQQPGQLCALLRLQVCLIGGAESGPERYTQRGRGRGRLGSRGWMDEPLLLPQRGMAGLNTPLLLPQRRRTNLLCG